MRTSLNLVTLGQGFDTIEGIKLAAAAGFEGVGIWADDFEKHTDPVAFAGEVAGLLVDSNVRAEEMCYVAGWMWPGDDRAAALDVIKARAEIAAAAGCPVIIACAAPGSGCVDAGAEDLRAIGDIGAQFGVTFALEFIGVFEQVKDLRSGLEIVRKAGHPNGKLLVDIFHAFRGGSTAADFALPKGDEVACVHMNDVPAGDVLQMADSDRVMPGDGVLPLPEILAALGANGYGGALSVEVFSADWWAKPAAETAAAALAGLRRVMG